MKICMVNVRPLAPQAPPWSRSPPGVCVCLGSWAGKDGSGANGQLPQLMGCLRRWSVPFTPGGACLSFSSLPLPSPPSLSCLIFLPFSRLPLLSFLQAHGVALPQLGAAFLSFPASSPVLGFLPRLALRCLDAVVGWSWGQLFTVNRKSGGSGHGPGGPCDCPPQSSRASGTKALTAAVYFGLYFLCWFTHQYDPISFWAVLMFGLKFFEIFIKLGVSSNCGKWVHPL